MNYLAFIVQIVHVCVEKQIAVEPRVAILHIFHINIIITRCSRMFRDVPWSWFFLWPINTKGFERKLGLIAIMLRREIISR